MTFGETANPDKLFFQRLSHTPDCSWCNELLEVSNLNLTVLVTDGYQYKDFEQV